MMKKDMTIAEMRKMLVDRKQLEKAIYKKENKIVKEIALWDEIKKLREICLFSPRQKIKTEVSIEGEFEVYLFDINNCGYISKNKR
jgi:hypothetical protein